MIATESTQASVKPRPGKSNQTNSALVLIETGGKNRRYKFVREVDLESRNIQHRVLYRADLSSNLLIDESAPENSIDLPKIEIASFLKGVETALNRIDLTALNSRIDKSTRTSAEKPAEKSNRQDRQHLRAIASLAMDAATDYFFEQMENNIDHWTYDASSKMLSDIALHGDNDFLTRRREAAEIQVKSLKFINEFRAFVIESLVEFKTRDNSFSSKPSATLELVQSDIAQRYNIEPVLTREVDGQTKVEFSQLNRRLSAILDKSLKPTENVLSPKSIATSLSDALNECDYTCKQRETLEPIIIAGFNESLEVLYHEINRIWIDMDILPEAKLEILNSEIA